MNTSLKYIGLSFFIIAISMIWKTGFTEPSIQTNLNVSVENVLDCGEIDWCSGVIRARGNGVAPAHIKTSAQRRLLAERAAKVDAYRNLAEVAKGVRVTSTTVVKDLMLESDIIQTEMNAFIKGASQTKVVYSNDGSCEVTLEASLDGEGGLSGKILSTADTKIINNWVDSTPTEPTTNSNPSNHPSSDPKSPDSHEPTGTGNKPSENPGKTIVLTTEYSGVVVIAGNSFKPCLLPTISDENGNYVYGPRSVSPTMRQKMALVSYSRSEKDAIKNKRVANTPCKANALKVKESTIVISAPDAKNIRSKCDNKLKECRVVIVY